MFGLRIFTVLEYIFFVLFIIYNLRETKQRLLFLASIPLIFLIAVLDYALFPTNQFDSLPSGIAAILGIIFCIYSLFILIRKTTTLFLYQIPFFWFISGVFIFYSGTLFLFLLSQQNLDTPSFTNTFIIINSSFLILRNVLFSIALTVSTPKELEGGLSP